MYIAQYDASAIMIIIQESAWWVADVLAPIWRQDISNHHDDISQWLHLRIPQPNVMLL